MLETMLMTPSVEAGPVGQVEWRQPGTYTWTVPEGVYSVSAALVGAGESTIMPAGSSSGTSGAGGAVLYRNDIAVTPGNTVTVVVGSGADNRSSSVRATALSKIDAFGLSAGYGSTVTASNTSLKRVGFTGGAGVSLSASSVPSTTYISGGHAATYTANGTGGKVIQDSYANALKEMSKGFNLKTGQQVQAGGSSGLLNGPGAGGNIEMSGSTRWYYPAGNGMVRIIWGKNRGFPDKGIGDL